MADLRHISIYSPHHQHQHRLRAARTERRHRSKLRHYWITNISSRSVLY
uniref:Uncharacterized protein n=1 Tax=Onchocerca volvulus TaxID=6282 RepID=A0A8R1TYC1_ONCVO